MRVAFQGEPGAYSELAARQAVGDHAFTVPCSSFGDVFSTVESGGADRGILPIENSTAGSVTETYDLLLRSSLTIVGEVYLRVEHCLLLRPEAELAAVRSVWSHPQALAQCRAWIESRKLRGRAAEDTAGAARWLAEHGTAEDAVLASRLAGELYGLNVALSRIQDEAGNSTRFVLVGAEAAEYGDEPSKTSLALECGHSPGALFRVLEVFEQASLNLTKLESRPIPERNWEYRFYLDFEGHRDQEPVSAALRQTADRTSVLRVLGSYPRRVPPSGPPSD